MNLTSDMSKQNISNIQLSRLCPEIKLIFFPEKAAFSTHFEMFTTQRTKVFIRKFQSKGHIYTSFRSILNMTPKATYYFIESKNNCFSESK